MLQRELTTDSIVISGNIIAHLGNDDDDTWKECDWKDWAIFPDLNLSTEMSLEAPRLWFLLEKSGMLT